MAEVAILLRFREACGPVPFAYARDWGACSSIAALIFPLVELTPLGALNWLLREPCRASLCKDLCDVKESGSLASSRLPLRAVRAQGSQAGLRGGTQWTVG